MNNIVLSDAFKQFTLDQDKVISPEETVSRFTEKLKSVDLDILENVVRIDNGRLDIPVYFSICGEDAQSIIGTQKQMGKGATSQQAQASAVMELAERFSFFSFCKNPDNFKTATHTDLKEKKIGFDQIAKSVHDESDDLAISCGFYENLPMKWTQAYNLTRQEAVWVPFDWFFTINEFNGPSAGNCVEEAVLQGICEIVERHVCSLISHGQIRVPAIRAESSTDPMVNEMLKKYNDAGIRVYISDFTHDMGIPSVGVMAYDPGTFPEKSEIVWTAGTTPCPEKALSRALTETAQLAGDFNTSSNYVASGLPKFTRLQDAQHIMSPAQSVNVGHLPDLSSNNIRIEVENCLKALSERNMEVYAIDTRHDRLDIPAFYTIIPGSHFRERALGTSVAMFCAKIVSEKNPPFLALPQLQEMDQKLPGKYFLQFYMGNCHLALGDTETALTHFNNALELDPNPQDIPTLYSYTGVCLKDMEKYREALAVLQRGAELDPERTDIFNLMGFCHFKLKEHEKAIENFKRVIQLNPTSAIDYANIGSNYRDMGRKDEAIRYYELALELDSSIEFARDSLAKLK